MTEEQKAELRELATAVVKLSSILAGYRMMNASDPERRVEIEVQRQITEVELLLARSKLNNCKAAILDVNISGDYLAACGKLSEGGPISII